MEAITIRFDPDPYLDALAVERRRLLFLDQSYWRKLVDSPSAAWRDLRQALITAVEQGRLLIPVTSWNLLEAAKLTDVAQLQAIADLMNTLSRNVVFVDTRVRLRREIGYFIRNFRPGGAVPPRRRRHAFSMWPAMAGDLEIRSHPSEMGHLVARTIAPEALDAMVREGIRLIEPKTGGYPDWLRSSDEYYERAMAALRNRVGRGAKSFAAQVGEEASSILLNCGVSFPTLAREIGHEPIARFAAAFPEPSAKQAAYLEGCPTLFASALIHAAYLQHGSAYKRSDFFDMENLILATPYADLVTFDRHATHIARNRLRLHERFGCTFLEGPEAVLSAINADAPAEA